MDYPDFVGPSNQTASIAADSERTLNLFAENVAPPGARPKFVLFRTPGLSLLQTVPNSPIRGEFAINGRAFAVAGAGFYELASPTTYILRGTIAAGTSPVEMADNSVQLCIVADGLGYTFTLANNAFAPITGQNGFPAYATSLTTIDTYFVVLNKDTNQFSVSAPLDGTLWSGADFGSSQQPDNAVALAQSHNYLWIFGGNTTVIFQDTGAASFAFQRVPGSQIEQGCAAAKTVCTLDNTLFWLGDDARGPAIVYRADGFLPTRISTHAVESAIQRYTTRADAIAYGYQEAGHVFYVLHFPTANATWVFDVATGLWHERAWWNAAAGTYGAHLARFHMFAWGKHIVGDYRNGNLYEMSTAFADDAGNPLRWLRAAPHLVQEQKWIFYARFQLDMQTGGGLADGSAPTIALRWSNDGGFTWSDEHYATAGALGRYGHRVLWRRLGRGRSRVFAVSSADPLPLVCLQAAYLDLEVGTS